MRVQAKIVFNLTSGELRSLTRNPLEIAISSTIWRALLSHPQFKKREGFLGISGVAVLPESGAEPEKIRAGIERRLTEVLGYLLANPNPEQDTVTGNTSYGPYKLGLVFGAKLDFVENRIKGNLPWLRRTVELAQVSANDDKLSQKGQANSGIDANSISNLFQGLPSDYPSLLTTLERLHKQFRGELAAHFQPAFNIHLRQLMAETPPVTYSAKKTIASWIKEQLEIFGFGIQHPDTGQICNLITLPGHDGKGVFLLEGTEGRKRSHTTTDLHSLLDFTLMDQGMLALKKSTGRSH